VIIKLIVKIFFKFFLCSKLKDKTFGHGFFIFIIFQEMNIQKTKITKKIKPNRSNVRFRYYGTVSSMNKTSNNNLLK
jgi:hypothetical protein